jgi:ABC-2 type transport system ATP-binding protein
LIYCEGCGFSRSPVINDPDVLFLDEPTLGLDVISARLLRKIILKWAKEGG